MWGTCRLNTNGRCMQSSTWGIETTKAEHGYHQDCYQGFRTLKRHTGQLLQIFVIWLKKKSSWVKKRNHLGSKNNLIEKEIILGPRIMQLAERHKANKCRLQTEKVKNEISKKWYLLAEIVILFPEQCKTASINFCFGAAQPAWSVYQTDCHGGPAPKCFQQGSHMWANHSKAYKASSNVLKEIVQLI